MSQTLPKLSHHMVDEAQYNLLRSVGYLNAAERLDIIDACEFGDIAHIKDKRKSGEPYITHPIAVAEILAGFRLDRDTIIAAILHDTVEDTEVSDDQLAQRYGEVVARLVDGVTKLKSSSHNKQQNKAATFHKILTATLDDPRVLIIKLADRLHNMSTLDAVRPEKQRSTAQETLDFYVPFARLMGLNDIADYIEVLCYRNLDSDMYNKLSDKLLQHGLGRNFQREAIHRYLTIVLNNLGLGSGHVKVLDNRVVIYRQFFRNRGEVNALLRHYAFEIVLDNIEACDKLAYYLIKKYQIDDSHISDNIRRPLPGGNQSLTLIYERDNDFVKVTILTTQMQQAARLGVIGAEHASDVSQSVIQASLRNMKELIDEDSLDSNSPDFMGTISTINELMDYLHSSKILCYSPQGRAYELPQGATALDFAYAVGPMVGNVAVGANVDGKKAKLGTVVKNGELVEIEVGNNSEPKAEWLGFVVTNKAREEILRWFKDLSAPDKQRHGQQALDRALKTYQKSLEDLSTSDWDNLIEWRGLSEKNALFEQISSGTLLPQLVVSRLFSDEVTRLHAEEHSHEPTQPQQLVANAAGVELDFANCCHPIYGDPIVGHLSRHGLVVHRHKCFSLDDIRKDNPYQVIQLRWRDDKALRRTENGEYDEKIRFPAYLKLSIALSDEQISEVIYHLRQLNIGVETVDVRSSDTIVHIIVRSRIHLAQGIRELRSLLGYPNIMRLYQL
ncbi:bifunctional (p)ppGpp synthetase/guanosine-3',5'-bis(diphosphate) 3'-pyrophosphohydrolase [Psychrobacter frigidicola]|uniref:GTP pyrophosphokinase n=1 Tax=Psychrobacter frigidicola TaxID=45611 RepID=A0A5C7A3Y3_9GAMM|nr:HD domain-containing protein [Psychrobacter frigidicola]TXD96480.1 bifunctional (p)ppGpp synthetase/guanosine-3',5'-bis(diphosphate) 3'-pyrophosphohydrolase [Psychrobacter frigidicola]